VLAAILSLLASAIPGALAAEPPPPANDDLAAAQAIHTLPATVSGTLVGSTAEPHEENSDCGSTGSEHTVWYSFRASTPERLAIQLEAAGELDATVDVYHAIRSELKSVACERTDSEGQASLTFKTSKNGLYDIRVASLPSSQLAGFTLEVYLPTPAIVPPGPRLPSSGVNGQVDRIQNVNAAYSVLMHAGVSYMISLANTTKHACVTAELFRPGTTSFEEGATMRTIHCGGFALFTPGAGEGGLYSVQLTPRETFKGVQHFHLQVAPAGSAETAPGLTLGNYEHAHGRLNSYGVDVLRLYRIDITSHSNLTLRLIDSESDDFNLQLRNFNGNVIECQCGSSGSQKLTDQLEPGRYYAVVSIDALTRGTYTLIRESRTITQTRVAFSSSKAHPGEALSIEVKVAPAVSGPATVEIERFDPVFGWQFYRSEQGYVSDGVAQLPFAPESVGLWRVNARFGGSRTASPSAVGFSYLLVS
jgi:hypothetical protein